MKPSEYATCVEISGDAPLDSSQAESPAHVRKLLTWACGIWAKQINVGNLWYPSESIFYAVMKKGQGVVTNGPTLPDPERDYIGMAVINAICGLPRYTWMEIIELKYYHGHPDSVGASEMLKRYGHWLPKRPTEKEKEAYEKKLRAFYQQYRRMREIAEWQLNEPLLPLEARLNRLCMAA